MTRKELSAVVAECAARSERAAVEVQEAHAGIEKAREGVEAARKRQEDAVARHEAAIRRQDEEFRVVQKKTEDFMRRTGEMLAEDRRWAKRIFAELADQRDERRALIEALLQAIDRLPPPPPDLRSA